MLKKIKSVGYLHSRGKHKWPHLQRVILTTGWSKYWTNRACRELVVSHGNAAALGLLVPQLHGEFSVRVDQSSHCRVNCSSFSCTHACEQWRRFLPVASATITENCYSYKRPFLQREKWLCWRWIEFALCSWAVYNPATTNGAGICCPASKASVSTDPHPPLPTWSYQLLSICSLMYLIRQGPSMKTWLPWDSTDKASLRSVVLLLP